MHISEVIRSVMRLGGSPEAPPSSQWRGRLVALVGGVALLGVLWYLAKMFRGGGSKPDSLQPKRPTQSEQKKVSAVATQFVQDHKWRFQSALESRIEIFQDKYNKEWTQPSDHVVWSQRKRPLGDDIQSCIDKVVRNGSNVPQELLEIEGDLHNTQKPVYACYEQFQTWCTKTLQEEKAKSQQLIEELTQRVPASYPQTVEGYLGSIGLTSPQLFSEHLSCSLGVPEKRGLKGLKDIDCLELRKWDKEVETLKLFELALEKLGEGTNLHMAFANYMYGLIEKVRQERNSLPLILKDCGLFVTSAEQFLKCEDKKDKLHELNKTEIFSIVSEFEALDLKRQRTELKAYCLQQDAHRFWTQGKGKGKTLSQFCEDKGVIEPHILYQLATIYH